MGAEMSFKKSAVDEMAEFLVNKVASAASDFKSELNSAKTKKEVDDIYNKYKSTLKREPSQEDWEVICNVKKAQLPEANDGMAADDNELVFKQLNALCSMADEFDNNSYSKFAKYIDEVIKKISTEAFKK